MIDINLKEHVRAAIRVQWPQFQQEHPHLAAAIDQQVLIEQATRAIAEDPEYQQTLAQAAAAGIVGSIMTDLVQRLAARWLRHLAPS